MGFEDKVEQSFGLPCRQTNGRSKPILRTHLIRRPARDIIPPLGGARVYWPSCTPYGCALPGASHGMLDNHPDALADFILTADAEIN